MSQIFAAVLPETFPALALAHFVALLSPGPDFFLIVGHAIRRRLAGAAYICVGIAFGNAVYIALAIAGWAGLRHSPGLYRGIELAGALYLAWMGFLLFQSGSKGARQTPDANTSVAALGKKAQFAAGLASALLNPKNAVFYLTLMTAITGPGVTLLQQTGAGIWMFGVVLLWDLALAAGISYPAVQIALQKRVPLLECLAGAVLCIVATTLMYASLMH